MSDERREAYPFHPSPNPHGYTPAFDDTTPTNNGGYLSGMFDNAPSAEAAASYNMAGFMDYDTILSKAFGLSPSTSDVFSSIENDQKHQHPPVPAGGRATPNSSSVSSSSTEAAGGGGGAEEEDSAERREHKGKEMKGSEDEDLIKDQDSNTTKKGRKGKKKGEKKEKEARVAFMTKSEVDHLEDGYRWRKYGQKAVKNSPFPRSYYRCTTQKCTVKKRVERSYQDPSIIITTYEGQHNHHIPATLRGQAAAAGILSHHPLLTSPATFQYMPHHQDLFLHMAGHGAGLRGGSMAYNINTSLNAAIAPQAALPPSLPYDHGYLNSQNLGQLRQQQIMNPDYGLLQDMVPSFLFKQEP